MSKSDEVFEIRGRDAEGRGIFHDNGFLVRAGSLARREVVPSAQSTVPIVRQRLFAEGVLEDLGGQLRFTKDYLFSSPSGAAAALLGRTANGWVEWKRGDGVPLTKVMRVARESTEPILDEGQRKQIMDRCHQNANDGLLRTPQQLEQQFGRFRERFGPAALNEVDGEALLTLIHAPGNRDSLVYWLEFKNDDEFETRQFGSIAGGSALKFRLFRRKETGVWQAGGEKGNQPTDITLQRAIEIARSHRDQLIKGADILAALPATAADEDYAALQDQLDEVSPDVSRLSWGHKYFSLLFPDKLDDYHNPDLQRFHLLKLLQLPPEGDGRYVCAGRFVTAAVELGIPLNHLTNTLNTLHGRHHRYWRIGTTSGSSGTSHWPMMREQGCAAVGWSDLGDLGWVEAKQESRNKLRERFAEKHPQHASSAIGRECSQLVQFVAEIEEGDVVVAADGMAVMGLGRVTGEYGYHPKFEFPHQRPVAWVSFEEWRMPEPAEGLRSTVRELGNYLENLLAIERRLQSASSSIKEAPDPPGANRPVRLSGVPGRIQSILERKGQMILYGPPGTGKTYWAERTATELASLSAYGKSSEKLEGPEREKVLGENGLVRLCCFHPAYGYEDFLEGYRPHAVDGSIVFELRDGVFKKLCRDAAASPQWSYYLVVDEINRGDIPRIFGELLTTLEKDKRGKRVILPVSQEAFAVPANVFLIGTMNTADRSISLLDTALRRRFGFVELMPDSSVLKDSAVQGIPLKAWLDALNRRIREHVGRDARNIQVGHSYLMHAGSPLKDFSALKRVVRDDIIPLIEEYCYEKYDTLENILGSQLVDAKEGRVRDELFEEGKEDILVQALLAPYADLSTTAEALSSEESHAKAVEDAEDAES